METTEISVRVIKPYSFYPVGRILYPAPNVRDMLLRRGLVEVVKNAPEAATVSAPESAMKPHAPHRHPGRPKKKR